MTANEVRKAAERWKRQKKWDAKFGYAGPQPYPSGDPARATVTETLADAYLSLLDDVLPKVREALESADEKIARCENATGYSMEKTRSKLQAALAALPPVEERT